MLASKDRNEGNVAASPVQEGTPTSVCCTVFASAPYAAATQLLYFPSAGSTKFNLNLNIKTLSVRIDKDYLGLICTIIV